MTIAMELLYFPLRAKGEPIRLVAAFAKIPLKFTPISIASWPEIKTTMPPGKTGAHQVPVLKLEDGTLMPESHDIALYLAEKAGPPMKPESPEALERAAYIFEYCTSDSNKFCCPELPSLGILNPILNFFPADEAGPRFEAAKPALREALACLETELGEGPFFTGSEPCYADLQVFHYLDNLTTLDGGKLLDAHAGKLAEFYRAVQALPGIKEYLAERPKPCSGSVGREGSIMATYADPSSR